MTLLSLINEQVHATDNVVKKEKENVVQQLMGMFQDFGGHKLVQLTLVFLRTSLMNNNYIINIFPFKKGIKLSIFAPETQSCQVLLTQFDALRVSHTQLNSC